MTLPASAQLPNYPGFLNARTYDAEFLRMMNQCQAFGEGIAPFDNSKDCTIASMGNNRATDLEVTTGGSGLNVSVAAGNAWVKGDSRSTQGLYFCYVDVAKTVTLASNSSGNPRVDAIILQVADSDASGALNQWSVTVQQGTATVGATLSNLTGAPGQSGGPALNGSALVLAYVLVPNGFAGPFVNATHILDTRFFAYRPGRLLGYVTRTSDLAAGAETAFAAATVAVDGVHRTRVQAGIRSAYVNAAAVAMEMYAYDGAVGGTVIGRSETTEINITTGMAVAAIDAQQMAVPSMGRKTYTAAFKAASGTWTVTAGATYPAFIAVRYI